MCIRPRTTSSKLSEEDSCSQSIGKSLLLDDQKRKCLTERKISKSQKALPIKIYLILKLRASRIQSRTQEITQRSQSLNLYARACMRKRCHILSFLEETEMAKVVWQ